METESQIELLKNNDIQAEIPQPKHVCVTVEPTGKVSIPLRRDHLLCMFRSRDLEAKAKFFIPKGTGGAHSHHPALCFQAVVTLGNKW